MILPVSPIPALSKSLGIKAKTLGVYPLVVGGSPTAKPISRWANANRVKESIINKTSLPLSRKYSAMAVATRVPLTLTSAG